MTEQKRTNSEYLMFNDLTPRVNDTRECTTADVAMCIFSAGGAIMLSKFLSVKYCGVALLGLAINSASVKINNAASCLVRKTIPKSKFRNTLFCGVDSFCLMTTYGIILAFTKYLEKQEMFKNHSGSCECDDKPLFAYAPGTAIWGILTMPFVVGAIRNTSLRLRILSE